MSKIYINGVSILAPMDDLSEIDIVENIMSGKKIINNSSLPLDEYGKMREYRMMDRISMIALLCFEKIIGKCQIIDLENCGTIVNTTFGPIETNVEFATNIIQGKAESVSPILFSHTVNNASLGHICKKFNMKGPSTLLLSSNSIEAAHDLISADKVKTVFVCGIEQYFKELFDYFHMQGIELVESAVSIVIDKEKNEMTYAEILGGYEENLGGHPYFGDSDIETNRIKPIVERAIENADLETSDIRYAIVNSVISNEERELKALLGDKCKIINVGECIGEMLGSSLTFHISLASMMCKLGMVKSGEGILAGNYDISGNYIVHVIGSV